MNAGARLKFASRVGLLQPHATLERNSPNPINKRVPSLLMKAYALALKSRFTMETDLEGLDQAIFIAGIQNRGIPIGVAKEFINEQIYQNANSMQEADTVTFQPAHGDFFQYLNDYVLATQKSPFENTPEFKEYYDLLLLTRQTLTDLMTTYREIRAEDPDYKWQDHVRGEQGTEYLRAWHDRDLASSKLPSSGVLMALKMFDSSRAKIESHPAQNMPCTLQDPDLASSQSFVDAKDILFRPSYGLPGFISKAEFWRDSFNSVSNEMTEITLDLKQAANTPWRALGFGHLDSTTNPIPLSAHEALGDYQVTLSYSGMAPFRITRGLWNIEDFRDCLKLKEDAPDRLKHERFRTNVLLLGYGVQIKVRIPDKIGQQQIFPELLSEVSLSPKGGGLWVTDTPSNDAYPVLLAALCGKC
ncbi:hypothetical protein K431DRAFT_288927 [Polychaeton citri CBS 116435]|uniref:Uncharacterized protein n=1 Tax=Polychaeton citri CBS 116435 TaxID=1314669 RepID=A0A9P4Q249_9PEZI|nr:hypothetical protein K431DRAFT_288927 [Polychaeton citri CBS 116435]